MNQIALNELAAEIDARRGTNVVRSIGNMKYEIVAGERRWRAAQIAQLHRSTYFN